MSEEARGAAAAAGAAAADLARAVLECVRQEVQEERGRLLRLHEASLQVGEEGTAKL